MGSGREREHDGQARITSVRSTVTISAASMGGSSRYIFLSGQSQTLGIPARREKKKGQVKTGTPWDSPGLDSLPPCLWAPHWTGQGPGRVQQAA